MSSGNHKFQHKKHESGFFEDNLLPESNSNSGGGGMMGPSVATTANDPNKMTSSTGNPLLAMMTNCRVVNQPRGPTINAGDGTTTSSSNKTSTSNASAGMPSSQNKLGLSTTAATVTSLVFRNNNNNKTVQGTGRSNSSGGLQELTTPPQQQQQQKTREDSNNNSVLVEEVDNERDRRGDGDGSTRSDKENRDHQEDRVNSASGGASEGGAGGDRNNAERSESVIFTGTYRKEDHELEEASRIRTNGKLFIVEIEGRRNLNSTECPAYDMDLGMGSNRSIGNIS